LFVGHYVWQHFHLSGSIVATSPSSSKTALLTYQRVAACCVEVGVDGRRCLEGAGVGRLAKREDRKQGQ
jgi:hypothetical protein